MFSNQHGSLHWMFSCQPFVFGEKGMLFVLAGEPDAEPCWDYSLRFGKHVVATGGVVLCVDGTGTNTVSSGSVTVGVYSTSFSIASEICRNSGLGPGDLIVIHSLDAWADWEQPEAVRSLAEFCLESGVTIALHTKYMGVEFGVFGDSITSPYASATFLLRSAGEPHFIHGRELLWLERSGVDG